MATFTLYYGDTGTQQFWVAPGSDGFEHKGAIFFWLPRKPELGVTAIVEGADMLNLPSLEEAIRKAHDETGHRFELSPDKEYERAKPNKKMRLVER